MSYIEDSLSTGEKIEDLFGLHWVNWLPMALWAVLAYPTFGITLILVVWEWLRLRAIENGITDKRVIRKSGVIGRKTDEIRISAIETVELSQSVLGRILGFGNIKVTGRGVSALVFSRVSNPMAVKGSIEDLETV